MDVQARAVLRQSLSLTSRHAAKAAAAVQGSRTTGKIHSLGTFDKYVSALERAGLWAQEVVELRHLRDLTPELAQAYLAERAESGIGQKQLDADRNALEFVTGRGSLVRERALTAPETRSRAYTPEQIRAVAGAQDARNALATEVAWRAGLRAHELLTLRAPSEATASTHRTWSADRFVGREGQRYVVTGKGGLRREVSIPRELAARLEAVRLATPATVVDRGIVYRAAYDIGGGNAWSKSFGAASARTLGWSNGAHGLRHTYAQERMAELQARGFGYTAAREIVSQELGHFRGEIVEVYLR
ncbi:MAG: integrase domain-containing protein [Ectothiorhodospiraceae bacterium]|nr:integrase domain-containing protein [Ectothiorhodospiraceae bacterium]